MKTRPFGKLNFDVSIVGFGGAAVSGEGGGYGFGQISESDAIDLLRAAIDRGINLFDTAPIYGFGMSEQRIGKAFQKNREQVFLVSKSGVTWDAQKNVRIDNDPKVTRSMLEQSLVDLKTDYIDLYMIHWPSEKTDIRLPMQVLSEAKRQGKIRAIGLCNTNPHDLKLAMEVDRVDVAQSEYHFFEDQIEQSLFPLLKKDQIGFMSWGTLAKGILTKRVDRTRTFDATDVRATAPWWTNADHEPLYRTMEKLSPKLEAARCSGLALALGFVLRRAEVSTALCGMKNVAQLESTIKVLETLPEPAFIQDCLQIRDAIIAN